YVDASCLTGAAAGAAKQGASVVGGGAGACNPGCATYDTDAQGRVFVEGMSVTRDVVYHVTEMKQVTETRRVPYTVTKCVAVEEVRKVPTKVTRMVPCTVTKCVPTTVCK